MIALCAEKTEYGTEMMFDAGMMSEIMQRGPITCSIACPDDFVFNYTGGVYTDLNNSTDVDHDVEVVGWGHEDGKDFWHVRNSWGKPKTSVSVFQFWVSISTVCYALLCTVRVEPVLLLHKALS